MSTPEGLRFAQQSSADQNLVLADGFYIRASRVFVNAAILGHKDVNACLMVSYVDDERAYVAHVIGHNAKAVARGEVEALTGYEDDLKLYSWGDLMWMFRTASLLNCDPNAVETSYYDRRAKGKLWLPAHSKG